MQAEVAVERRLEQVNHQAAQVVAVQVATQFLWVEMVLQT
jgi:hypothetical protein